jgi:hypothetical protein
MCFSNFSFGEKGMCKGAKGIMGVESESPSLEAWDLMRRLMCLLMLTHRQREMREEENEGKDGSTEIDARGRELMGERK